MGEGKETYGGRIFACVIAAYLAYFGVESLVEAHHLGQQYEQWQTARPVDISVDLSTPGEYSGVFRQTCQSSHGEVISLHVDRDKMDTSLSVPEPLNPPAFRCEITDSAGSVIVSDEWVNMYVRDAVDEEGVVRLFDFHPFKKGDYTFTLTVTEGAEEFAGVPQRVVASYSLCGLEGLPAALMQMLGVALLVIAGIIVVAVGVYTIRRRRRGAANVEAVK